MSFSDLDYLRHMLDEAYYLRSASAGLTQAKLMGDETLRRAFVRSIEIIGEAARRVSDDFRSRHPQIEWRAMAGMRNRLIHDYLGVDYDIVWDVVAHKIPALRAALDQIIKAEESNGPAS